MRDMTIAEALANKEHLIALGETEVYLYRDTEDFPFDRVTKVEAGSSWRLSGPSSVAITAEQDGLSFRMSIDFEGRDANGKSVSLFDRGRLRELIMKLPPSAQAQFADMLEKQVLPPMMERSADYRKALGQQLDSEDCVRGLITFGRAPR